MGHRLPPTSHSEQLGRGAWTAASLLLLASVALNVILAHRVQSLMREHSREAASVLLQTGEIVPPVPGKVVGGSADTLGFDDDSRPTVLYFFHPACGWCARNLDNFKALIRLKSAEYRFVGLTVASGDSVKAYLAQTGLALPTYTDIPGDVLEAYKLTGTPTTLVVSPKSAVVKDWPGAYVGEQAKQVAAFFHVALPGLRPVEPHR